MSRKNHDLIERVAKMLKESREAKEKSQDYMAKHLAVSRRSIQNWESGISAPSHEMILRWFTVLDLQPMPYILELLCPDRFEGISAQDSDLRIEEALISFILSLPSTYKRMLLYLAYGDHGSSPIAVLELLTAYLHTTMDQRLYIDQGIRFSYGVAVDAGAIVCPDHVKPSMQALDDIIDREKDAVTNGKDTFTIAV